MAKVITSSYRTGRRAIFPLIAFVGILTLSGCVDQENQGDKTIFCYALWVPAVTLFVGLAVIPLSRLIPWRFRRYRIGFPLLGMLACVLAVPSVYMERVTVSPTGFIVRTGIWGLTSVHEVELDQLSTIRVTKDEYFDRKGNPHFRFYLLCERKTGEIEKVPFNTTVGRQAITTVLKTASSAGIPVLDQTH